MLFSKNIKSEERRKIFLKALFYFIDKKDRVPPYFNEKEMKKYLNVPTRADIDLYSRTLSDEYCYYEGVYNGDCRYNIHEAKCLSLKHQLNIEDYNNKNNKQSVRETILAIFFGTLLGVFLTLIFLQ